MNDIKKTLKTAGIWCLIASLLCIASLFANIYLFQFSIYLIISNVFEIVLSITTSIIFLCYSGKSKEIILNKRNLFYTLSIINIFNNLIVWVLSFWVQITINKEVRTAGIKQFFNIPNNNFNNQSEHNENNPDVIVIDENNYSINRNAENLTARLEELKKLRKKNLISQDEYEKLRQEALKKFMS